MKKYNKLLVIAMAGVILSACDSDKPKKPLISVPVQVYSELKVLKGMVTDSKGPVRAGTLIVKDRDGKKVAETMLEKSSHFKLEIPAGTELPIELSLSSKATTEKLRSIVISKAVSEYDISTLTTRIAKHAKELGGYTYGNMVIAADSTVGIPDANKTSTGFRGDPTKQYGGWH